MVDEGKSGRIHHAIDRDIVSHDSPLKDICLQLTIGSMVDGSNIRDGNRRLTQRIDLFARRVWHSVRPSGDLTWLPGSTFCYTRAFWQNNRFPGTQSGEDIRFLRRDTAAKIVPLQAHTWWVDIVHQTIVSPKPTDSPLCFSIPLEEMRKRVGDDAAANDRLAAVPA